MKKSTKQLHANRISSLITSIEQEVAGMTFEQFSKEEQVKETVYHQLQELGQNASHLLEDLDEDQMGDDLDLLTSLKNAQYNQEMEVGHRQVWNLIHNDLAPIRDRFNNYSTGMDTIPEE